MNKWAVPERWRQFQPRCNRSILLLPHAYDHTVCRTQLRELEKTMPHYTYAAFTRFMENGLASLVQEPSNYLAVVKSILVEAGTDVVSLPNAIAKAKPVALDDPEMGSGFAPLGFEY